LIHVHFLTKEKVIHTPVIKYRTISSLYTNSSKLNISGYAGSTQAV